MDDVSSSTIADIKISSVKEMPIFHLNQYIRCKIVEIEDSSG